VLPEKIARVEDAIPEQLAVLYDKLPNVVVLPKLDKPKLPILLL
jgi:hypothetical protein